MLKSGFLFACAFVLTTICWLGQMAPVAAQTIPASLSTSLTLPTLPTLPIVMAKKPLFSFSGQRPTNLGVKDGKLAACPDSPNCVSSQAAASDAEHSIAAIAFTSSPTDAIAKLKTVIAGMDNAAIITEDGNYLYAEFTSGLMGFVDDVEFVVEDGAIQVRSASRLGKSDLGVNRKRIEAIRSQMA
jgi:uncharacterized protein (DUF1499 family)